MYYDRLLNDMKRELQCQVELFDGMKKMQIIYILMCMNNLFKYSYFKYLKV